jgi:hypothetical protein
MNMPTLENADGKRERDAAESLWQPPFFFFFFVFAPAAAVARSLDSVFSSSKSSVALLVIGDPTRGDGAEMADSFIPQWQREAVSGVSNENRMQRSAERIMRQKNINHHKSRSQSHPGAATAPPTSSAFSSPCTSPLAAIMGIPTPLIVGTFIFIALGIIACIISAALGFSGKNDHVGCVSAACIRAANFCPVLDCIRPRPRVLFNL